MIRNRTAYSFRSAIGDLKQNFSVVNGLYGPWAPITDTASTFGFNRWQKLADKAGVKPVFGIELAVSDNLGSKKPTFDNWTFIAQEDVRSIHELLKLATAQFRYVPILSYAQANSAKGVFKFAGRRSKFELLEADTFVLLEPGLAYAQYEKAVALELKFAAAFDNRYIFPDDKSVYQAQLGRDASIQTWPQWIMGEKEWRHFTRKFEHHQDSALTNSKMCLEASSARMIKGTLLSPPKPKSLLQLCEEGAERLGVNLRDPIYKARMDRELKLIADKKFEDYFFIIADICQWARPRMIVGPARGSSCGSLVCFLLEITTVDPIPYGLIFERFIDLNRDDLPDIDIDFSDNKRHLVFEYMADKYGADHIARLGTVAMFKPRSALQTAAISLDIPRWKIDKVADAIIERSGGDSRALQATEDTLKETPMGRELLGEFPEIMIAGRFEGQPTHHSQHAAGVILTERPVIEYVGVDSRTGATHCDKKDAEDIGLLKIDALGLTQLSIFEDCLEMLGLDLNHLNTIDMDDPKAYDVLNKHHYAGIFQFNGIALQSITDQVEIKELNDIVAITALARPGPLNTGGTNQWIKVKTGKAPMALPHPVFEPYLRETLGVVAYQEQVMNIGREIGGLSWEDVTALRKAMSKSLGKEFFDKYGDSWKLGAIEKGVPPEVADKVWDDLCAYGSWAFNKSHAVAYGIVSYFCCWLKAHYPVEFAAASLTHAKTEEAQIALLREMHYEGTTYKPVDKDHSTLSWAVGWEDNRKILVGPLTSVKGIGLKGASQILSARARNERPSGRTWKLLENPKTTLDDLWPIESRFKVLIPNPAERNIHTPHTPVKKCQSVGHEKEVLVFCTLSQIKPLDENEEMKVSKRNGKILTGPTQALNLRLTDDTDTIFAKVDRFKFEALGRPIIERGRPGKALYAVKGTIPPDFRMISVKQIRYIGDLEND
jgi:DNA polymerase III alpha subunit